MTEQIVLAAMVAAEVHAGQTQHEGKPYIGHVRRVVGRVMGRGYNGLYVAAAWLHDVVEDSEVTLHDLTEMGFDIEVVDAVEALTKRPGERYEQFILRADQNVIARVVKRADVEDHLAQPNAQEFYKYPKYLAAREVLSQ
jgi:(p)ppGpp synthase/HD superfamily hydrolase